MIRRDRKILTTLGWIAGVVVIVFSIPMACQAQVDLGTHHVLNELFGPPNSGQLESSIAAQILRPGVETDLERMAGGKKQLRLVQELWSYSDPFGNRCTMIVVLDDGSKQFTADLEGNGEMIWAAHRPPPGSQ